MEFPNSNLQIISTRSPIKIEVKCIKSNQEMEMNGKLYQSMQYLSFCAGKPLPLFSLQLITEFLKKNESNPHIHQAFTKYFRPYAPFDQEGSFDIIPEKGILLYGPPGTGKTRMAEDFSAFFGIRFLSSRQSSTRFQRSLYGETVQEILKEAELSTQTPFWMCCMYFDEMDAIAMDRDNVCATL
jgi:SpoVK/Ycf46/Vps4 family AAA+-type ATPase